MQKNILPSTDWPQKATFVLKKSEREGRVFSMIETNTRCGAMVEVEFWLCEIVFLQKL